MRLNNSLCLLCVLLLLSCGTSRKATQQFDALPVWVKQKPMSNHSYYGLGKARKNGFPDQYIKEAERQALSDMAEQISTAVSSSSLRYQFDVENQTSDFYMNTVKTKSDVFFEGYKISQQYEDKEFYWNLVEISKVQFKKINAKRKQRTLTNAYSEFQEASLYIERGTDALKAIKNLVSSLEILKPYWKDSPIYTTEAGLEINLLQANINAIKYVFDDLTFARELQEVFVRKNQVLDTSIQLGSLQHPTIKALQKIPFVITTSMYYGVSKTIQSEANGLLKVYPFKVQGTNSKQYLQLDFSSEHLFKSLTSDLELRSLLNSYVTFSISEQFPVFIEFPKLEFQVKIMDAQFTEQTFLQETRFMFEKENIQIQGTQIKEAYFLEVSADTVSKNTFNFKTKLTNPKGEILYNMARIIKIDVMVYKTKLAVTKQLVNSFKRKEFKAIVPLLH
jgi:hypothetical protein